MGNCHSAGGALEGAVLEEGGAPPRCVLCGQEAAKPLRRLRNEEREEWCAVDGRACHRRCAVAHKLEEARQEREKASYARAKREVYPLPTMLLHSHHGGEMHRVGSGQEWARTESFRQPYQPSSSVLALQPYLQQQHPEGPVQQPEQQQGPAAGVGGEAREQQQQQQEAQQENGVEDGQQQPKLEQRPPAAAAAGCEDEDDGAASDASPVSPIAARGEGSSSQLSISTSVSSSSHSSMERPNQQNSCGGAEPGSSSSFNCDGGSGEGSCKVDRTPPAAQRRRVLLRRPSPVHYPALLEAKTLRRISGPHPSFDGEAMQADPDGGDGKSWRQRCEREAEEARTRAARAEALRRESNGF